MSVWCLVGCFTASCVFVCENEKKKIENRENVFERKNEKKKNNCFEIENYNSFNKLNGVTLYIHAICNVTWHFQSHGSFSMLIVKQPSLISLPFN